MPRSAVTGAEKFKTRSCSFPHAVGSVFWVAANSVGPCLSEPMEKPHTAPYPATGLIWELNLKAA